MISEKCLECVIFPFLARWRRGPIWVVVTSAITGPLFMASSVFPSSLVPTQADETTDQYFKKELDERENTLLAGSKKLSY